MTDLAHLFGSDLSISVGGDVQTVDGTDAVTQRVYRRLLTAPGGYLWQLAYGSGLPAMVGQPVSLDAIQAVVAEQMAMEPSVDQTQPIAVDVVTDTLGGVSLQVLYTDAASGAASSLSLR